MYLVFTVKYIIISSRLQIYSVPSGRAGISEIFVLEMIFFFINFVHLTLTNYIITLMHTSVQFSGNYDIALRTIMTVLANYYSTQVYNIQIQQNIFFCLTNRHCSLSLYNINIYIDIHIFIWTTYHVYRTFFSFFFIVI